METKAKTSTPRRNPFRPSFGKSPAVLAGRADILDEFQLGLDEGPGGPGRTMLVSGPRGMGKTVLVNELEDTARSNGWIVVRANPGPNLISDLVNSTLPKLLREFDPEPSTRHVTGGSVAGVGGVRSEVRDNYRPEPTLGSLLERLTDVLAVHEAGVLLSIDELQSVELDQLSQIATVFQNCVRDDRDVALVAAGLPIGVKDLLDQPGTTFLRRAQRVELGPTTRAETRLAIESTIEGAGRSISAEALDGASDMCAGYPYLIQLVGYHAWRQADDNNQIEAGDVTAIRDLVIERIGTQVHQPALRDLSDIDRAYLDAMATDDGPSSTVDIAGRLGKDMSYQSMYRQRLLDREIIIPTGRGYVDFELPYLRDYLRQHDH